MPPNPTNIIPEPIQPQSGTLYANISLPVNTPPRPVAVVTSKLAQADKLNKQTQFNQMTQDLQNHRQNVQAIRAQQQKNQQIQDLTMRTPADPTQQIDEILKNLTKEL